MGADKVFPVNWADQAAQVKEVKTDFLEIKEAPAHTVRPEHQVKLVKWDQPVKTVKKVVEPTEVHEVKKVIQVKMVQGVTKDPMVNEVHKVHGAVLVNQVQLVHQVVQVNLVWPVWMLLNQVLKGLQKSAWLCLKRN